MRLPTRFLWMAVDVVITALLMTLVFTVYSRVQDAGSSQINNLASVQDEYNNSDAALYNGEIVDSATATSIARKYSGKLSLSRDGMPIGGSSSITRSTFSDDTKWLIKTVENANRVVEAMEFTNASGSSADPATLDDAKQRVASIAGINVYSNWTAVFKKVEELGKSDVYRAQLASMAGLSDSSNWNTVYAGVSEMIDGYRSSDSVAAETITLTPSDLTGKHYNLGSATAAYITAPDGTTAFVQIVTDPNPVAGGPDSYFDWAHSAITQNLCTIDQASKTIKPGTDFESGTLSVKLFMF